MAVCALQALCGISEPFVWPSCLARIVGRVTVGLKSCQRSNSGTA